MTTGHHDDEYDDDKADEDYNCYIYIIYEAAKKPNMFYTVFLFSLLERQHLQPARQNRKMLRAKQCGFWDS
jgi:hypothetical protein